MQCHDFECRMQLLLDHRIPPTQDRQLRTHAAVCDPCKRALEAQSQLLMWVGTSSTSELPGGLATAVLTGLDKQCKESQQTVLAIALVVSLAGLLLLHHQFHPNEGRLELANTTPITAQPTSPLAPADTSDSATRKLTGQAVRLALEQWKTPIAHWNAHSSLPMDQIADGLRPIASSFSIALDALRRTFPGSYRNTPPKPQTQRMRSRLRLHSFT